MGHSCVAYGPLSHGLTGVLYEGSFDYPVKNQFAKIIDDCGVTIFYTAPTLIRMFMKWGNECLADAKLNSLRILGSAGEPLNPEAWLWYHANLGHEKCPIIDTWWQTETGAPVVAPLPGLTPLIPGSPFKALPGYKVAVLDDHGEPASKGYVAIMQPYPSMMRGIYKDPERYQSTYWSKWGGKYYFSGDYASSDDHGYLWFGGRCDEVLKSSGYRIGTTEIENALIQHPMVAEVAVCGVSDVIKGEKIIAFIILKDGCVPDDEIEAQLKKFVAKKLGSYASPSKVVFVHDLPKTKSGKILRRLLKDLVEGRGLSNISTLNDPSCLEELTKICQALHQQWYLDQNIRFQEISALDETWGIVEEWFSKVIVPIYGAQDNALRKLSEACDRKGYILFDGENPVGILIYKTELSHEIADLGCDNSLELKTLFVINSGSNSGKGYGSKLVDKIIEIAKQLGAKSIHSTISAKIVSTTLEFFLKKGFFIIKTNEKHHETGEIEYTLVRKLEES